MKRSQHRQHRSRRFIGVIVIFVVSIIGMALLVYGRKFVVTGYKIPEKNIAGDVAFSALDTPETIGGNKEYVTLVRRIDTKDMNSVDSLRVTIDTHGLCLNQWPASLVSLKNSRGNWYRVHVSSYVHACGLGAQDIDIALSDFKGLIHLSDIDTIELSFWYPSTFTLQVKNIQFYNSQGRVLGVTSREDKDKTKALPIPNYEHPFAPYETQNFSE